MGFLKVVVLIGVPLIGSGYLAYRLGSRLPIACRLFGNYIGLGYVYFKSLIKHMKPSDEAAFQLIKVARKTSQQSQALRRELRNTFRNAKNDIKNRRDELFQEVPEFKEVTEQIKIDPDTLFSDQGSINSAIKRHDGSGSTFMADLIATRQQIVEAKNQKREANKFFEDI